MLQFLSTYSRMNVSVSRSNQVLAMAVKTQNTNKHSKMKYLVGISIFQRMTKTIPSSLQQMFIYCLCIAANNSSLQTVFAEACSQHCSCRIYCLYGHL